MLVHSSARRLLVSRGGGSGSGSFFPFAAAANACSRRALAPVSASAMSYRGGGGGRRGGGGGPNSQRGRGRGGGGAGRGGGGGGRGGGGRGEQRWWDPQWRAERLRQMAGEVRGGALRLCVFVVAMGDEGAAHGSIVLRRVSAVVDVGCDSLGVWIKLMQ
jgi:ATP-dependent RNA helicase DHX36